MTSELRLFSGSPVPEKEPQAGDAPEAPRSNGQRGRVIGPATAKRYGFASTVNGTNTIGVIVSVGLERGASVWKGAPGPEGSQFFHPHLATRTTGRGE
jgi:hypothetical protein